MDPRDAFLQRVTAAGNGGGIVPVMREIVTDADTPVAAFAKIARPPFAFLLESLVGGERWARYTFLGTEPREAWRYRGDRVERWTPAEGWEQAGTTNDPITHLADRMRAHFDAWRIKLRSSWRAFPTISATGSPTRLKSRKLREPSPMFWDWTKI